ncbi:MAG: protein jag [Acidaminococcaceae bacterium]|nr:protein jag [Acidaminococcaceae bacterium]MBR1512291.1 protein jag [Acidaminococcaceae bacterium]
MNVESVGKTVEEALEAALKELNLTKEEVDYTVLVEPKKGFLGFGKKEAKILVTPKVEKVSVAAEKAEAAEETLKDKIVSFGEKTVDTAGSALRAVGEKANELDEKQKAFNDRVKDKWNDAVDSVKESGDKVKSAVNEKVETANAVTAAVKNTLSERKNKRTAAEPAKEFIVDDAVVDEAKDFLAKIFKAMKIEVMMEKFVNKKDGCVVLKLHGDDMGILIGKHGQTLDSLQYLTNLVANKNTENRVHIVIDVENYRERRAETLTRLAKRLADKVKKNGERIVLEPMNPHERKIIHTALQNDSKITTLSEGSEPYRKVVIELKK